ncbi:MAG: putative copper-importing P-type ATPase A [Myxococcota bacterium]|nr:putative copper-importing P-type ATPase A [Myxococcota bacterium]
MASSVFPYQPVARRQAEEQAETLCLHCGTPVPRGLVNNGAPARFCCSACETVYGILREGGLERYYDLVRESGGACPVSPRSQGRGYEDFDDPGFIERYVRASKTGAPQVRLYLENIHCAACLWLLERIRRVEPGILSIRVDLPRSMAEVTWDDRRVTLSAIARLLDKIGYAPHPWRGENAQELRRQEDRAILVRMGVSGAIAANVMLTSIALYSGLFGAMDAEMESFFRWTSLGLIIPAMIWGGDVFFKSAWRSIVHRAPNLDVPIVLGIAAGMIGGTVNVVRGAGEIYFDSLAMLIFLLLGGRWLQRRGMHRAADAAELVMALTPSRARLVEGEGVRDVPVETLKVSDLIEVRAGETIPADGLVTRGESDINLAWLTGESRPSPVTAGTAVHAGAVNLTAPIRVRVSATGEQTRIGRLMDLMRAAAENRAPIVRLADRFTAHFLAGVTGLAALTLAIWWGGGPEQAIEHAVALLIVGCPCVLGLATPLAFAAAIGCAARKGVLIKGGDAIERLAGARHLWLDKTGTLTEGRMRLVSWTGDEALKPLFGSLERHSSHPIADAAAELPGGAAVESFSCTVGGGVSGVVNGVRIDAGSLKWVLERAALDGDDLIARARERQANGETVVAIAAGGRLAALAGFRDPIRADAKETVDGLRRMGFTVGILSGDDPLTVRAAARELGVPGELARGGVTPEGKLELIRNEMKEHPVVMVGDGVNDAAALSAASAGVAVHGGAEAGLAAANIYLNRPGVAPVLELARGARRTMRVVRSSLLFALFYNLFSISLAVAGLVHPLTAAIIMPLSSLTVVVNSTRARSF